MLSSTRLPSPKRYYLEDSPDQELIQLVVPMSTGFWREILSASWRREAQAKAGLWRRQGGFYAATLLSPPVGFVSLLYLCIFGRTTESKNY
jgi:hypothetical protein